MYHSRTSLTPLLSTNRYGSLQAFEEDCQLIKRHAWQLIGVRSQLASPGDNLAAERLGVPVLVRNCDGQLVAFRNVCAHRHCKLYDDGPSHSEAFKCRYHGWNYGADGRTRRLPGAKNFPHFDRESYALDSFAVDVCGELVFVKLDASAPSLREWLGDWFDRLAVATDRSRWAANFEHTFHYDVDWKIPVEGSLESYHLEEVHAKTFGTDPGEEASEHHFEPWGTRFTTRFRGSSLTEKLEAYCLKSITGSFDTLYEHGHVFPNLMASLTDSLTLVYQIRPTSAGQSELTAFGFGPRASNLGWLGRALAWGFRSAGARVAKRVLDEDAAIFPHVQAGMRAAVRPGIFGRCEERLFAFHQFMQSHTPQDGSAHTMPETPR